MATAECKPITRVWGRKPQHGPGAEPLVRGAKPPKAETFFSFWTFSESGKFAYFSEI